MIVIDKDSLLVERQEDASCGIYRVNGVSTVYAPAKVVEPVVEDETGEGPVQEAPVPVPPSVPAFAVLVGGELVGRHIEAFGKVDFDIKFVEDIAEELGLPRVSIVCLRGDGEGFFTISVVLLPGDTEYTGKALVGGKTEHGIGFDAPGNSTEHFAIMNTTLTTATPAENAVISFATYARHNDAMSDNYDQYIAASGELIENGSILEL